MLSQSNSTRSKPSVAYFLTTLLACGWGLLSAYLLFDALLIRHAFVPFLTALVPMIVVWATLERKRWGRLALLGLSETVIVLTGALLILIALVLAPRQLAVHSRLHNILHPYGGPIIVVLAVLLAVVSSIWLRRPRVAAEFEQGKRATLATPQRVIAAILVGFWAAVVLLASAGAGGWNVFSALPATRRSVLASRSKSAVQNRTVSSRISRSDAEVSNL